MRLLSAVVLVAFFVLLTIFSIGSWSCQQSPKPKSETEKTENASPKNCATSYGTFIVGLNESGAFVRTYDKEIVATSTVVIATFTVILGLFTVSLARSTRIAAEAANLAALAAIGIELPILRVRGSQIELDDIDEGTDLSGPYASQGLQGLPRRHSVVADIDVKNFGRTHAFPTQIALGYAITKILPSEPRYRTILKRPVGAVIEPDKPGSMAVNFGIHLTPEEEATVRAEEAPLWFYFSISYRDFMDNGHEARFCYRWACPDRVGSYYFTEGDAPPAYTRHT